MSGYPGAVSSLVVTIQQILEINDCLPLISVLASDPLGISRLAPVAYGFGFVLYASCLNIIVINERKFQTLPSVANVTFSKA